MMTTIHPRPTPAPSDRAVIPFLLSHIIWNVEKETIVPHETSLPRRSSDCDQAIVVRLQRAAFPFADGALMYTGNAGKLVLSNGEDVFADVFDGAHAHLYILTRMFCQHARANLFYAYWNVIL